MKTDEDSPDVKAHTAPTAAASGPDPVDDATPRADLDDLFGPPLVDDRPWVTTSDPEEVRYAATILLDLAQRNRRGSIGWDPAGQAVLKQAVALLSAYREQLRARALAQASARLLVVVASVYRVWIGRDAMSSTAYAAAMTSAVRRCGWEIDPRALRRLLVERARVTERRGPIECTAHTVGELFGVGPRQMLNRLASTREAEPDEVYHQSLLGRATEYALTDVRVLVDDVIDPGDQPGLRRRFPIGVREWREARARGAVGDDILRDLDRTGTASSAAPTPAVVDNDPDRKP